MSWQEAFGPSYRCTFRSAEFLIQAHSEQAQRRLQVHEYPRSDLVEIEDLGQGARRFSIEAFVLGADYMVLRNALQDALDAPGPGMLSHPYRGQLQVVVDGYSVEESARMGGCAEFRIAFIRYDVIVSPRESADTVAAVKEAAELADAGARNQVAVDEQLARESNHAEALTFVEKAMQPVANAVRTAIDTADRTQLQLITGLLDPVAGARSQLAALIGVPSELASRLQDVIHLVGGAADLRSLVDSAQEQRLDASDAEVALAQLLQTSLVVQACRLSADTEYASYDEALAEANKATESIDQVSLFADDDTFDALQALRAAVSTDLRTRALDLARITHYTPGETLPAIVIAHRLYGAALAIERSEEIVARNAIAHPGFVAGGVALEVLTP